MNMLNVLICFRPRTLYLVKPDSKVHGANMGPTWGRQETCWPDSDEFLPCFDTVESAGSVKRSCWYIRYWRHRPSYWNVRMTWHSVMIWKVSSVHVQDAKCVGMQCILIMIILQIELRPTQVLHDDIIKWKHFPRNWPFVRGIHRSRWIPHTKASDAELWCFLWSNKRLSKQPWG